MAKLVTPNTPEGIRSFVKEDRLTRAYFKPFISRYVQFSLPWPNAKNGSILYGYRTHGMVKQQEAVEKVYTGA